MQWLHRMLSWSPAVYDSEFVLAFNSNFWQQASENKYFGMQQQNCTSVEPLRYCWVKISVTVNCIETEAATDSVWRKSQKHDLLFCKLSDNGRRGSWLFYSPRLRKWKIKHRLQCLHKYIDSSPTLPLERRNFWWFKGEEKKKKEERKNKKHLHVVEVWV